MKNNPIQKEMLRLSKTQLSDDTLKIMAATIASAFIARSAMTSDDVAISEGIRIAKEISSRIDSNEKKEEQVTKTASH